MRTCIIEDSMKRRELQLLIPAAGMGSRLGRLTTHIPKCMIKINGETLIERTLKSVEHLNITRIIMITGHKSEVLKAHIASLNLSKPVIFIHNENYASSNNIVSVAMAECYLSEMDTVLVESDLIFDPLLIENLIAERQTKVVLAPFEPHMDGTVVTIRSGKMYFGNHREIQPEFKYFKTVNIYQFTKEFSSEIFIPLLKIYLGQKLFDSYYETPLKLVGEINSASIQPEITNLDWFEIDDVNDKDLAENMFSTDRMTDTHSRYGGFWRFPNARDFTYLSNPFFPNKDFIDEIRSEVGKLIHHYPSSQKINSNLMSAILDVDPKFTTVGNGGSELIKMLMTRFEKSYILSPTFKEYENRSQKPIQIDNLSQIQNDVNSCVIIVNPNNPNGQLLKYDSILEKIKEFPKVHFIIDESFMDFAVTSQSLLSEDTIKRYDNLIILKSIGKSHGIGGLRLGAIVTSDESIHADLPPIWNINSIAEFYMQRFKKYEKHYFKSLDLVKESRKQMEAELASILNIQIEPSQGNFVYLELEKNLATKIQNTLFEEGFIIKPIELTSSKSALRIAVRSGYENSLLTAKVKKLVDT